jgi:hypothetical protein
MTSRWVEVVAFPHLFEIWGTHVRAARSEPQIPFGFAQGKLSAALRMTSRWVEVVASHISSRYGAPMFVLIEANRRSPSARLWNLDVGQSVQIVLAVLLLSMVRYDGGVRLLCRVWGGMFGMRCGSW